MKSTQTPSGFIRRTLHFFPVKAWMLIGLGLAGCMACAQEIPTIVDVPNQAMFRNSTKLIPVVVGTNPAVAGTWTVSAVSSDTSIVPNESVNLFVSGNGTNRVISVRPALDKIGKTTITVLALDSLGRRTNDTFVLDVRVTNAPPVIEPIADVEVLAGVALQVPVVIRDEETVWENLILTAMTDTDSVISTNDITFTGTGSRRVAIVKPSANLQGISGITLTVLDTDGGKASATFLAFVNRSNESPEITAVPDQFAGLSTPFTDIKFNISDLETPFTLLVVSAESSNPEVLPSGNIVFTGTGFERQVSMIPADGKGGISWITLTVRDRLGATASTTFRAVVQGPSLDATLLAGQFKVSWANLNNLNLRYVLDSASAAGSLTVWQPVTQSAIAAGDRFEVSLPVLSNVGAQIFRLRRVF